MLTSGIFHISTLYFVFKDLKKYFDSCGGQISMKTVQVGDARADYYVVDCLQKSSIILFFSVFLLSAVERPGLLSHFEYLPQRFEASEHTHHKGNQYL